MSQQHFVKKSSVVLLCDFAKAFVGNFDGGFEPTLRLSWVLLCDFAKAFIGNFDKIVNNRLFCSCQYFSHVGIPCRHIMYTLIIICPEYQGVTHHDVSVVWWSIYSLYGYRNGDCMKQYHDLSILCESLRNHDVDGPLLPSTNKLADIPIEAVVSPEFMG
jgi:hypothetical protein